MHKPTAWEIFCIMMIVGLQAASATARRSIATEAERIVDFSWDVPPLCECPPDLLQRIAERAGVTRQRLTRVLRRLHVRVTRPDETPWHVSYLVDANGTAGTRVLALLDCRAVVDAAVLLSALAVAPARPAPAKRQEPVSSASAPVMATRRDARGAEVRVYSGVGVRFGLLPSAALDLSAGAEVGGRRWGALLEVAHIRPVGTAVAGLDGAGAELSMPIATRLAGCVLDRRSRFLFAACMGAELGWLRGASSGVRVPADGSALFLAFNASARATVRIVGPLLLQLDGDLGLAATRPVFVITGLGAVHQPALFEGRLRAGLGVVFF